MGSVLNFKSYDLASLCHQYVAWSYFHVLILQLRGLVYGKVSEYIICHAYDTILSRLKIH